MESSLVESLEFAKCGKIFEWLIAFLETSGDNKKLASCLIDSRDSISIYGPAQYPLLQLKRCCGPEEGMKYRPAKTVWDQQIEHMRKSIETGWEPQPIIAGLVKTEAPMCLLDGNHRHEALLRVGMQSYWTIVCVFGKDSGGLASYIYSFQSTTPANEK